MEFNGNMVKVARESRRLTQTELSEKLDISQVLVSKIEADLYPLTEKLVSNIAEKLSYPISFFENNVLSIDMGTKLHRKRLALTKKDENYIDSLVSIYTLCISKLLNFVDIEINIPEIPIDENNSIPDIACELRNVWNIPKGTLPNLIGYMEKNGIFVFDIDMPIAHFDAVSTYNNALNIGIIVINKNQPADRYRFTLAHELGHLIMHRNSFSSEKENEANNFASAFLMPEKDIYDQLQNINFWNLTDYKQIWKVSMAALIRRAYDLSIIDKRKYTSLNVRLSQEGYKKCEPLCGLVKEKPSLFKDLLTYFSTNLNYSEKDILSVLSLFREDYIEYFDLQYSNNFSPKVIKLSDYKRGS